MMFESCEVRKFRFGLSVMVLGIMMMACSSPEKADQPLFTPISSDISGIRFTNNLLFDKDFNIYTYRNYYNGGGVALGDINNDGLVDVYLTGNISPNKLFLNRGNFKFEEITEKAGVTGKAAWSTGVSMADVNGDGLIDIYVCNSGDIKGDNKQNELFINNGDLTFTERAEEYGIADRGFTTHAAFFDYDKDGDLDLYILNNSYQAIGSFNLRKNERPKRDSLGGDKFMRNDGGKFIDISEEAGIYGSVIGFGLGVTVGDINKDGWLDIFVSNDFFERDYLYLNKGDGTFKECLTEEMKSISGASMGADLADINNDSYPDIFVTEMLPKENARLKTVTTFENWDRYKYNLENDYYHQFTRNMLQLSNGDGTFSEIGRLAGVEATDWSWGALVFDMDNDGLKDIFVSNGIFQDLTNQDYLQYVSDPEIVKTVISGNTVDYKRLIESIPSNPVSNFAFQNQGDLGFVDKAKEWGLGNPGFSNGAAYGDLDNDGDLDLVINNVNEEASVFRNETNHLIIENHFLKFDLKGLDKNTFAFGTKITITHKNKTYYIEQMPIRGFESSMDPRPNIGLGKIDTVEQILITWPDGKVNVLSDTPTNQIIHLSQSDGVPVETLPGYQPEITAAAPLFQAVNNVIDFVHKENDYVDFDSDHLIYHMLSTEGPRMSKGDLNGDGLEDFYVGGAKDEPGALFLQTLKGGFSRTNEKIFEQDKASEDMGSALFDADNDGDLDLYVCSGGSEFANTSTALIDRLYLNDGKGNFTKSKQTLPTPRFESTSTVKAADYDGDGDQDLFVGVRLAPQLYGVPVSGYILSNDGKGNFREVSKQVAPALQDIGMITDAAWCDVDGDKDYDLVVVGEYMPIKVLINNKGIFVDRTDAVGLSKTNGWWNRIEASDLDHDGDVDFVIGNHGLNSRFKASVDRPVCMYVNDFDRNGTVEQIICTYNGTKSYPMVLRHDLVSQIPALKKKYLKYENYKDQTITDIFTTEELRDALKLDANELATSVLLNEGQGKFSLKPLPVQAQMSPVYGIGIADFDGDSSMDIVLGGNLYNVKPEVGRYDANYGVFLKGDGKGNFVCIPAKEIGLRFDGEVRDIIFISTKEGDVLLAARNNDAIMAFKENRK
ncbi:MAG: VCBS repeat-containing protein [Cyclobacteriaceae bacterium]|nr:VCBS repeat-containing protein [Cyclobacteriaceae bacterium]